MTNPISPVQRGKLPAFVRSEYPAFEAYMMKYFQWLETDDNFVGVLEAWQSNNDASNQVGPYVDAILADLGWTWTGDLAVEKRVILATLRDFYLSRGTKKSFTWLFRALFDQPVEVRYPRESMLVPSQADYATVSRLFFTATSREDQAFNTIRRELEERQHVELVGMLSGTKCTIETMQVVLSGGNAYVQAEISEPLTDFIVREDVQLISPGGVVIERLHNVLEVDVVDPGYGMAPQDTVEVDGANLRGAIRVSSVQGGKLDSISIVGAGEGYSVGDRITSVPRTGDSGFGLFAYVTEVDLLGGVTAVRIANSGRGYKILPALGIKTNGGTGADIRAVSNSIGAIQRISVLQPFVDFDLATVSATQTTAVLACREVTIFRNREYKDRIGVLGENSTLTDSLRHQQFSYDMVSAVSAKYQAAIVDELLHPVGYVRTSVLGISLEGGLVTMGANELVVNPVSSYNFITTSGGLSISTLDGNYLVTK